MDLGIKGKKALICASSKGIGKAAATALAKEGVLLFLCARNTTALQKVANEIESNYNVPVAYQACDLTDTNERDQLIVAVNKAFSNIDILIHNTGGPKPTTAEKTGLADWELGFHNLFQSVAHLNQAFLPTMKKQNWGRIITVTSLSVMEPIANLAISNAMRTAVTSMLKTLADEVAAYNISINCVAPGVIETDRLIERIENRLKESGGTKEIYLQEYLQTIPSKRLGSPEEVASMICYLCSQQAGYITGSTIAVDGGKRRSAY